jgi:hypothetical protein
VQNEPACESVIWCIHVFFTSKFFPATIVGVFRAIHDAHMHAILQHESLHCSIFLTAIVWYNYFTTYKILAELEDPDSKLRANPASVFGGLLLQVFFFSLRLDVRLVWLWRRNKLVLSVFTIAVNVFEILRATEGDPGLPLMGTIETCLFYLVYVSFKITVIFALYGFEEIDNPTIPPR